MLSAGDRLMMAESVEKTGAHLLDSRQSALLAVVGGVVDMVAGGTLLGSPPPMMPITVPLGETNLPTMMPIGQSVLALGYFLLGLGVLVFLTGVYMFFRKMMMHRSLFGLLMIGYGIIMLVLGAGMIGNLFSMMQGSALSGTVMLVVGVAMLYSGATMARK